MCLACGRQEATGSGLCPECEAEALGEYLEEVTDWLEHRESQSSEERFRELLSLYNIDAMMEFHQLLTNHPEFVKIIYEE